MMPMIAKIEQLDSVPSFNTLNRYAAGLGLKLKISIKNTNSDAIDPCG